MYRSGCALRATLFYLIYTILFIWFGATGQLLRLGPYGIRSGYVLLWNRISIACLKWLCGVRYQVIGKQHLPTTPYVALAKHQSQWETIFLPYYLAPITVVLKKSLLRVPFFGWGLQLIDPIGIHRKDIKQAFTQIQQQGLISLHNQRPVMMFPESTRVLPGQVGRYARTGTTLAIRAKVPVVPIALDAGYCWPTGSYVIKPGKVTVIIGEPIDTTDRESRELTEQVKHWIEQQVNGMKVLCK